MKDWRGTPIKVGAHILYPSRQFGQMWVTESVVTSVDDKAGIIEARKLRSNSNYKQQATTSNRVARPNPARVTVIFDKS